MTNTKRGFKCIAIHDMARASGSISANTIYPVNEVISEDYQIITSDSGRGFALTPGNGRWVNAGEPFVEFVVVDIEVPEEAIPTAPDVVYEGEGNE
ncbi:hypothetical protein KMI8_66 [Klebsiella phage KMI8]|nr:hypothetical protein KMI8_66 [Klebsiella phage KMI8]